MLVSTLNSFSGKIAEYITSEVRNRLLIITPYIKVDALERLLENIPSDVNVSIITTWKLEDLGYGSSELALYPYCKKHNYSLYLNPRVHLKVISCDWETCMFGSANITHSGLALRENYNYEIYSDKTKIDREGRNYLNQIFFESEVVTDRLYEWYQKKVQSMPKLPRIVVDNTTPYEMEEEREFLISALPMSVNPSTFYLLYASGFDSDDIEAVECGIHDKVLYRISDNLPEEEFYSQLREMFFSQPFISSLLSFIDEKVDGRYFGEVKEWIQKNCTDVPVPSRRDLTGNIQVLYRWISTLSNQEYVIERPSHSERIRKDI